MFGASLAKHVAAATVKVLPLSKVDSEFGPIETEEEKKAVISPKSSMISSRLAEPETADTWSLKLVEFCNHNKDKVAISVEKLNLVRYHKDSHLDHHS